MPILVDVAVASRVQLSVAAVIPSAFTSKRVVRRKHFHVVSPNEFCINKGGVLAFAQTFVALAHLQISSYIRRAGIASVEEEYKALTHSPTSLALLQYGRRDSRLPIGAGQESSGSMECL